MIRRPPSSTLFPYTPLSRSDGRREIDPHQQHHQRTRRAIGRDHGRRGQIPGQGLLAQREQQRSEEHTSELQSPCNLVCRLLLEKKKEIKMSTIEQSTTSIDI